MVADISLKNEIIRKSIHIATAVIPLYYYFAGQKEELSYICLILFIFFLTADLSRIYFIQLSQIYEKILGNLLRSEERGKRLNGATLLFLGFLLAVLLFDKTTAVIVMLFISIADSIAAIVGKSFGKTVLFNKTLQGSVAFFITAFLIASYFNENMILNICVAAVSTLIELLPIKINDNITIPIAAGSIFSVVKSF